MNDFDADESSMTILEKSEPRKWVGWVIMASIFNAEIDKFYYKISDILIFKWYYTITVMFTIIKISDHPYPILW